MLNEKDIQDIKQALADAAPYIEEPITYREYVDTTPGNQVKGIAPTDNYNDVPFFSGVRELSLEEVNVSGGSYVHGDVEFSVRVSRAPVYKDRIIWNGASFKPKSISHFYLGEVLWWDIKAGKE